MLHAQATSIHKGAYIQSSDPGAVGAKVLWLDTTSGYVLKKRKDDDSGWDTIADFNGFGTGDGDVVGQSSSVDSEIALFSGTGGKTIKRATNTGMLKASSGVIATAAAGTDYVAPGGALGTPSSGTLTNCTADGTNAVGTKNIPQNSQSANYTTVLGDAGKHIYHPTTDDNPRTFTIDSNANVAYPIGTAITFVNDQNTLTIAITSDTLVWAEDGSTGSRTLAENGIATAIKVTSTRWIISGAGLS